MKKRSLAEIGACPNCNKPFIEAFTGICSAHRDCDINCKTCWDGHTYKADCDCMNENLRFSIG